MEAYLVSPEECQKLWPVANTDDIIGGLYVPKDGVVDPTDLCRAYEKGAKLKDVKIIERVCVEGVMVSNGRVAGVNTDKGNISCDVFVNCGGQWARDIGLLSSPNVHVPLHSTEHFYMVSKPMKGTYSMMPVMRDPCGHCYYREWGGGILAGVFEPQSKPCFHEGIPKPFEFMLFPEDWDHFNQVMDQILLRIPALEHTEIRQLLNGPESFTPDNKPVIGESPNIKNYYVAAGMCSHGIAGSGGIGRLMAEWIVSGKPQDDVWSLDIRRFGPQQNNKRILCDRVTELLGFFYSIPWPKEEYSRGRKIRVSPLHSHLDAAGASWGQDMGWEVPNWYTKNEQDTKLNSKTFGWPNWFDNVKDEVSACRSRAAVFDLTSQAKFILLGDQVHEVLQRLCSGNVGSARGDVLHSIMFNHSGGVESSCFVMCLDSNRYLLMTPGRVAVKAAQWLTNNIPDSVLLCEVTTQHAVIGLVGPRARDILQKLTLTPLDQNNFVVNSAKVIELGDSSGVILVSHCRFGEETWEIVTPVESAVALYEQLMMVGQEHGIQHAGMYAMDALRVKFGMATMGNELGTHTCPWEACLDKFIDWNKGEFNGRSAILESKAAPLKRLLVQFSVIAPVKNTLLWGGESIYFGDNLVGSVTSAAYCHSTGQPIGLGYISSEQQQSFNDSQSAQVEINGLKYAIKINKLGTCC